MTKPSKRSLAIITRLEKELMTVQAGIHAAQTLAKKAAETYHERIRMTLGHDDFNEKSGVVCISGMNLFGRRKRGDPKIAHCIYARIHESGRMWTRWCIFCDNPEDD